MSVVKCVHVRVVTVVMYMYKYIYVHVHVQAVLGVSSRGLPGSWKSHVCTEGIFKSRRGTHVYCMYMYMYIIAHAHMVFCLVHVPYGPSFCTVGSSISVLPLPVSLHNAHVLTCTCKYCYIRTCTCMTFVLSDWGTFTRCEGS